jgi:hypothetical protein
MEVIGNIIEQGDTMWALFRMVRKGTIIVAIVGTAASIGPARAQGLATKRGAPEITSAGYSIAAEEKHHAGHVRHTRSQQSSDNMATQRVAPEIGSAGYSIASEERRHAAYPRRR